ncbi:hypothetical protein AA15237_0925 [Komagataeibacter xylinus NBRC 15237]|nr:hypothetical protein AA15237_0925 [Komagataeibacter xylinus NBRC 15237]
MTCCTISGVTVSPGTYALLRFDRVPPSKPHYPFTGNHYHYVVANKNPSGKCFWNGGIVTDAPIKGALPQPEDFV